MCLILHNTITNMYTNEAIISVLELIQRKLNVSDIGISQSPLSCWIMYRKLGI